MTAALAGTPSFAETRKVSRAKKRRKARANHPMPLVSVTWGRGQSHSHPNRAARNRAPSRCSQSQSSRGGDAIADPSPESLVEAVVGDPCDVDAQGRERVRPPLFPSAAFFRMQEPKQLYFDFPIGQLGD